MKNNFTIYQLPCQCTLCRYKKQNKEKNNKDTIPDRPQDPKPRLVDIYNPRKCIVLVWPRSCTHVGWESKCMHNVYGLLQNWEWKKVVDQIICQNNLNRGKAKQVWHVRNAANVCISQCRVLSGVRLSIFACDYAPITSFISSRRLGMCQPG